jgi:ADP-ribosylglycohydrolase
LRESLQFAGAANYCPVLVGAMAGILYGVQAIPPEAYQHPMAMEGLVFEECLRVAENLARDWNSQL